eukprot:TRINITY_DN4770_c1_g1_i2.p1 TRINITY_DN4770_c1_g1~~TRINITY_DN4770_c1_g1_i2.p1  ORF type:complete len:357 (-),score=70.65 TRINITY_DN4770_c1_g1_i2:53-1123(-)
MSSLLSPTTSTPGTHESREENFCSQNPCADVNFVEDANYTLDFGGFDDSLFQSLPFTVTETILLHILRKRRYRLEVNKCDVLGRTLLHHAVFKNFVTATNLLVLFGWDEKITDFLNKTALDYAKDVGHWECLKVMTEQQRQDIETFHPNVRNIYIIGNPINAETNITRGDTVVRKTEIDQTNQTTNVTSSEIRQLDGYDEKSDREADEQDNHEKERRRRRKLRLKTLAQSTESFTQDKIDHKNSELDIPSINYQDKEYKNRGGDVWDEEEKEMKHIITRRKQLLKISLEKELGAREAKDSQELKEKKSLEEAKESEELNQKTEKTLDLASRMEQLELQSSGQDINLNGTISVGILN